MAPPKKRLGKKHRNAQSRPHKGATPRGARTSASSTGSASPKGRKTASAKKSAEFSRGKLRTQSPERQRGRVVGGETAARPPERGADVHVPKGSQGADASSRRRRSNTRSPRERMYASAELDLPTGNAIGALLPLTEELQRPSHASLAAPLVAICGRPNVGKSTIFNRLTGTRRSITGDEPGITRDRIYGEMEFDGRLIRLVDTGGVIPDDESLIPSEIFRQAQIALEEADAIVMVVDGRSELAAPDLDLSRLLLRSGKPVFLAVNKMDTGRIATEAENFRRLGFREVFPVSGEHGLGMGELMDAVVAVLPEREPELAEEASASSAPENFDTHQSIDSADTAGAPHLDPEMVEEAAAGPARRLRSHGEHVTSETRVAIIGRPNVGKSTLLNALTGTGRAIVSPVAGTTRDAVDETVTRGGHRFRFVDTAGIRRKGKTTLMAEKLSVVMARKHLEAADVAILVIDATEGVTALDATIGGYAHESGRSVVVVVNKWDAVTTGRENDARPPADRKVYTEQVRDALKFLDYAPLLFISAAEGLHIDDVFKKVQMVARARRKRITTGQMNRFLDGVDFSRAGVPWSKRLRIYYMTQAAVAPPTFVLFTDRDVKLHFSYERFLENLIRESFGFPGTPIWFKVRARKKKGEA